MSLITEDGTGLPNAESYCSVADADKYFEERNIAEWSAIATSDKEANLRKATDYIELRFSERFKGVRLCDTQSLSFPRANNGLVALPRNLQRACAEYALRARTGALVADPTIDASGQVVVSATKKLGPMEKTTQYASTARDLFRPYPAADNLLKSLLRSARIIR